MAFSDTQMEQISAMMNAWVENNRPPEHIRPQLDIGWRVERQSVFTYEIRPDWKKPTIIRHFDFAKATWVQRAREWRIYWKRGNLKWDLYDSLPTTGNLQRFLLEIDKDPYGCFRG